MKSTIERAPTRRSPVSMSRCSRLISLPPCFVAARSVNPLRLILADWFADTSGTTERSSPVGFFRLAPICFLIRGPGAASPLVSVGCCSGAGLLVAGFDSIASSA